MCMRSTNASTSLILARLIRMPGSSSIVLLLLTFIVILDLLHKASPAGAYTRADFPSEFVFGASSSALQVEGAASQDGRTPSFLDHPLQPEFEHDGYKMDVACDEYHKYKEDVKLMADTGLDVYKFSISWPRLIPHGRGPVNPKAVEYYNNLINELISHGIQPHVMLWHWDLPLELWDEYGGHITSRKFVDDLTTYADVCFREFGDRVLHWTTINEPNMFSLLFCNNASILVYCKSSNESYIAGHNFLLAHASAVSLYRTKYQEKQRGFIGFNLNVALYAPKTDTTEDILAAQRAKDFHTGWFMNPLMYGDYPETMKKAAGSRLPSFTKHESELIKNSFDFLSINCYWTVTVNNKTVTEELEHPNYYTDMAAKLSYDVNDDQILQPILESFKQDYGNPLVYIYENGPRTLHDSTLNDTPRIEYLNASIGNVLDAIRNGSRVRGYLVWSFLDMPEPGGTIEWTYGLYYVNFSDPVLRRYPKSSAYWYASFLKGNTMKTEFIQEITNSVALSQAK